MLSKIFNFSNRKTDKKALSEDAGCQLFSTTVGFYPDLDASQIRVLIFKDCDRKGKTLLYDSKVVAKSEEKSQVPNTSKQNDKTASKTLCTKLDSQQVKNGTNGKRKSQRRPSSDSTMLGEMIFGSVAMTYKGSTVKVHVIRSPHQLLMTKVFSLRPRLSAVSSYSETNESLTSSQVDSLLESSRNEGDTVSLSSPSNSPKEFQLNEGASTPVAVPGIVTIDPEDDSGFTASLESLYLTPCSGSMTSLYNLASSPCGNLQRRLHRSQVKSIDGRYSRKQQEDTPESEPNSPILRRQPKIGIGILFPLSNNDEKSSALQRFFFAHFPLFDSHVYRLRCAVEKACYSRNSFSVHVLEAIDRFCEDVSNLLKTPRLKEPVWLTMMSFPDHRRVLCEQFMEQFTAFLNLYNNRETSFFLSSLLSAVLTHHLAWVPTVMPAGAAPDRAYLDKHSSQTLDLLAQSHPYNPLWAQLSDLYGAIGYPLKLARTVITGKNSKLIGQLLNILSYFIRCTEVSEHNLERIEMVEESGQFSLETIMDCCLCNQNTGNLSDYDHKHHICDSCIEKSGLSICENCQKLIPKELNGNSDKSKELVLGELLQGLPCCIKCGLIQKDSRAMELIRLNTMSGSCSCLPKWAVAKELKHFLNGAALTERSETFRCYCCDIDVNNSENDVKATFQCYCIGDDKCSHCIANKNGIISTSHNIFDSINGQCNDQNLENIFMELLSHDQFCPKLECSCSKDDAASVELDLETSQDNVEKIDIESNDSYGRSGSLDSGFHQSSTSSCTKGKSEIECLSVNTLEDDDDEFGPEELPLIGIRNRSDDQDAKTEKWKKHNNFGHSLFSGVSDVYHPDFVLQGVTCDKQDFLPSLANDLCLALQHSVIDDVLSDAVCIVADTDNWTCELISAKKGKIRSSSDETQTAPVEVSNLVLSMLSSVAGLWNVKIPAEFCLMHLEDRLKEIYLKSRVIAEWLFNSKKPISRYELAQTLGIDDSDVVLLLAVASSHSPQGMTYVR